MEKVHNLYIIVKGFSLVAQSKLERSTTILAPEGEPADELNREKQSLIQELNILSGDTGDTGSKATCLQYIPKDMKVDCRLYLDVTKIPVRKN